MKLHVFVHHTIVCLLAGVLMKRRLGLGSSASSSSSANPAVGNWMTNLYKKGKISSSALLEGARAEAASNPTPSTHVAKLASFKGDTNSSRN
eukprot:9290697-Alexandrium_andersonii.AAC.1